MDQVFAGMQMCGKYPVIGKKVLSAFMNLGKGYNMMYRKGLWKVLPLYSIGGRLLSGVKKSM